MKKLAVRALAVVAVAGAWAGTAVTSTADAAVGIAHHPRIAAGPRATGWSSSNWSGYAKTGGPFTSVSGRWVVPSVAPSRRATYSSSWVGIDGFNNNNLIQTGTEQDYYNGSAHYYAWWEILPAAETSIGSMTVRPGDVISATITQVSSGRFSISISDGNGQSFSITQSYSGPLTSAEWVQEAPTVGGHVATLARYSSPELFDPGTANGGNPHLAAADGGVMVQKGAVVSTPSDPDSDSDGFNISYGSTAPAAPAS